MSNRSRGMKGRMYDGMILEIANSLKNKNIFPSISVSILMSVYPRIKSAQPMIYNSKFNRNKKSALFEISNLNFLKLNVQF